VPSVELVGVSELVRKRGRVFKSSLDLPSIDKNAIILQKRLKSFAQGKKLH